MKHSRLTAFLAVFLLTLASWADDSPLDQTAWRIHSTNKPDWSATFAAANAIDGNPDTYWYQHGLTSYDLVLDLGQAEEIKGFQASCHPQRANEPLRDYELYVSDDPDSWGEPAAESELLGEGASTLVTFAPRRGRFVLLRALVDDPKQRICVAELNLLGTGAPPIVPSPTARFERRNEPGEIAVLGRDFLGLLHHQFIDLHVNGLRGRPEYLKIIDDYQKGNYEAALTAFRDYYLGKLRHPQAYGLTSADVSPFSSGITGIGRWSGPQFDPRMTPEQVTTAADKLMAGNLTVGDKEVMIGEPGDVNWNLPLDSAEAITDEETPYRQLYTAACFTILVQAWHQTGNTDYLQRWFDYLDDWALNCTYRLNLHPSRIPHADNADSTVAFIRLFAAIAAAPGGRDLVPPATLARVLNRQLRYGPMSSIAYLRSNCHNWTPGMGLMLKALLLDEFKVAERWFREARRRNIEDNAVTQNLRDGTENQQCPWYNDNYLQVHEALRLLEARINVPTWQERLWLLELRHDMQWRQSITEHLTARLNYYLLNRTPQNQWPIPWRGGDKRGATGIPAENHYGNLQAMAPDAYAGGENWKIIQAITNPESGIRPSLTGNWFPYGGYNIAWEGWERDSGYGALFCSPQPGAYGGFRSRSNNNTFGLAAFGQDLLIEDTVGHYMYPSSPIKVDGRNQFFHAGIYKVPSPSNHKSYQVSAWTEPAGWRWHASASFNLMEGVYSGPYGELSDKTAVTNDHGPEESLQGTLSLVQTLQGITHQRLVQHLRGSGLWIITDRMSAADGKAHDFEQIWHLPLKPSDSPAFEEADISVDADARRIVTASTAQSQANLTLNQFSTDDLTYTTRVVPNNPKNRYMVFGRKQVHVTWQAQGPSQVITLAIPRATGVSDTEVLTDLEQLSPGGDACGFAATTPAGARIEYLAAAGKSAVLELGAVNATAESLLLVTHGASISGIVLGCTSFQGNAPETADFEFIGHMIVPIHRPIDPVTISPNRNVFMDKVEVTMSSKTPGVEIRYTLDGSEPTPHSRLYVGPFTVNHTAVVKARAYRPGVTENPAVLSGTHATVVTKATLTRQTPQAAKEANAMTPGLTCRYYEGEWQRLWMFLDELKPLQQTVVNELFDLSVIPADNPPVGEAPAPRQRYYALEYSGYLDIPADGVYTIHAPREFVYPDTDAGYELRVYLGERRVPYGGRTEAYGLNEWYPATSLHAFGNWSIALKQGLQPFRLVWVDYRTTAAQELNRPGLNDYIWSGVTPDLKISGPDMEAQPIPTTWLVH